MKCEEWQRKFRTGDLSAELEEEFGEHASDSYLEVEDARDMLPLWFGGKR